MVNDKRKWPDPKAESSHGELARFGHSSVVQSSQVWWMAREPRASEEIVRVLCFLCRPLSEAPFLRGQSP
ncbi:hypothetical protein H5410_040994 [Solanum commersonii]|uniref:Uncharacterized protein n=1 Tax=Solanum commersonii TaxID=4109 RepID=A0A9J5XTJ9_SOLCO|nr:hypothetical protein H5410_040994 [Solanum commersonii]